MSFLISQIIPSLQTLKIIGDVGSFQSWLESEHPNADSIKIFEGYKFSLICCLNCFVEGLAGDELLGIKNDFLLDRSIAELVPIDNLENSCEKTIFLKVLKPYYKAIVKAKSYDELKDTIARFNEKVYLKFDKILEYISVSKDLKLDWETSMNLLLIDFAYTHMTQVNNNGPTSNSFHPLSPRWVTTEEMNKSLIGYAYSLQYLWIKLIGKAEFVKTHLTNLHLSDSWRHYKYNNSNASVDYSDEIFNRTYNLEEQSSIDSYFGWARREIIDPLCEKYRFDICDIDSYFTFHNKGYSKKELFKEFLDEKNIEVNQVELNWTDRIRERLYWYTIEVVDKQKVSIHQGIPAFNAMLAGTVTLHNKKKSEFEKVVVTKFIHPYSEGGEENNYSYGILIDTKSTAGYYSSGWVIYQNACGDYSGFSGSEHRSAEKLIEKFKSNNKIELRELIVPLSDFTAFTDQYVKTEKELSIIERNRLIPDLIQKSRGYLLELITYQACIKYYGSRYNVAFSSGKKSQEGERDVVITNEDEVILIECKLNLNNQNIKSLITKTHRKIQSYSQSKKLIQFWVWHLPKRYPEENGELLDSIAKIKTIVVSKPNGEPVLRGFDLKLMKYIMQDYENASFDYNLPKFNNNIWK